MIRHCWLLSSAAKRGAETHLTAVQPSVVGVRFQLIQDTLTMNPLVELLLYAANFALASRFKLTPCSAAIKARLR